MEGKNIQKKLDFKSRIYTLCTTISSGGPNGCDRVPGNRPDQPT
jgi:hypothetical protein